LWIALVIRCVSTDYECVRKFFDTLLTEYGASAHRGSFSPVVLFWPLSLTGGCVTTFFYRGRAYNSGVPLWQKGVPHNGVHPKGVRVVDKRPARAPTPLLFVVEPLVEPNWRVVSSPLFGATRL